MQRRARSKFVTYDRKMDTVHAKTHIHPHHAHAVIQKSIQNIPGGKQLFNEHMAKKQFKGGHLAENRQANTNDIKHRWR